MEGSLQISGQIHYTLCHRRPQPPWFGLVLLYITSLQLCDLRLSGPLLHIRLGCRWQGLNRNGRIPSDLGTNSLQTVPPITMVWFGFIVYNQSTTP
ncbi:hypothetical protein PoB_005572800 [Plakobranchus ocellatus]|uniref:Uncharacterized protein n=1 Tax=Plakobranchus ocellatus TaxID=259542 RepID=A0AAV4CCQ1_9GAST|nr:hypothetical protein PoB_005572800 [Plakobranchus ocellatus]